MGIACLVIIFALSLGTAAQCPISPGTGVKASDWDAIFTQDGPGTGLSQAGAPGWTGGDSTYSLPLPNCDTAFFFSDSYIGESPQVKGDGTVSRNAAGLRTTRINCTAPFCDPPASVFSARNSIVVFDRTRTRMRTLTGQKDERGLSTSYFKDPAPGLVYWMGDAILLPAGSSARHRLFVFLHKFDGKLKFHGASLAELDPSTLAIRGLVDVSGMPSLDVHWGTAMTLADGWLYIYGKGGQGGRKQAYVARTRPDVSLEQISRAAEWSGWDGNSWVRGTGNSAVIIPPNDSISDEFNVVRLNIDGRETYVFAAIDTTVPFGSWRDVTLYSSCSPQGPFTGKHVVYRMPEANSFTVPGLSAGKKLKQQLVVYNPHIHPQFTHDGRILISYNLNRTHNSDSIYIDGYRPRFIYVPIAGLK